MNKYINTPKYINYNDVMLDKYLLSPSNYRKLVLNNNNVKKVSDLLQNGNYSKVGTEVGSLAYINKSKYYFIRTRAIQPYSYLLDLNSEESVVPIMPQQFKNYHLSKGDILLVKDASIGEVAYLNDDMPNYMISGGIVRLRFRDEIRFYVLAFMKHDFFRAQLELMTERGSTIRHSKSAWKDVLIPFPSQNNRQEIIDYVSCLVKAIIRREIEIRKKYNDMMNLIRDELTNNQKSYKYKYSYPTINDVIDNSSRLDAGIYCDNYVEKQYLIINYKYGANDIYKYGYLVKRGQNLQVTEIGESIYTDEYKPHYYKLIRPKNLSDYGTILTYEYLGNPNELQCIKNGEILFSAEGSIGKFCVFIDVDDKTITNIHGITIYNYDNNYDNNIFLGAFLGYLRSEGIYEYISVGGQGGSLAQSYFKHIRIPKFPSSKKKEIAKLYNNNNVAYSGCKLNISEFDKEDDKLTQKLGIWQLDKQIKKIREKLNETLHSITMNENVNISFSFFV